MIKFFRKIRYNLMETGKTGKYFKYAIGEIVLVVIGILIALQINNWNENRLNNKEEKVLLLSVKKDFLNAISEFEALNKIRTRIIESTKKVTNLDPTKFSTDSLHKIFILTLQSPTFNNKAGSLNVLLTSGKINLISNYQLKESLIQWPGDIEDMVEDELSADKIYHEVFIKFIHEYLSFNDLFQYFETQALLRFEKIKMESISSNSIIKSDYESLLKNKKFINTMQFRAFAYMITNKETESLIKKAKEIIKTIDKELNLND